MADKARTGVPETPELLTTTEVATFVARGYLSFPALVDADVNVAAIEELEKILAAWGTSERSLAPNSGQSAEEIYPDPSAIGTVLRHPRVSGAIRSLLGQGAVFDHDFVHMRPPHDPTSQRLHADAIVDPNTAFDIQIFYFPHEVARDGGGTGFVPGTHLRRIHETDVGRYQHMLGEQQWSGPAGSVLIFHHGLWHRGMANPGDLTRLMYKIRLNPTVPQVRKWNTSDLEELQNSRSDHIFAQFDQSKVAWTLRHREPWMGEADFRLELLNRAKLWRYLTGDNGYDIDWYLTRIEGHQDLDHAEGRA